MNYYRKSKPTTPLYLPSFVPPFERINADVAVFQTDVMSRIMELNDACTKRVMECKQITKAEYDALLTARERPGVKRGNFITMTKDPLLSSLCK